VKDSPIAYSTGFSQPRDGRPFLNLAALINEIIAATVVAAVDVPEVEYSFPPMTVAYLVPARDMSGYPLPVALYPTDGVAVTEEK